MTVRNDKQLDGMRLLKNIWDIYRIDILKDPKLRLIRKFYVRLNRNS